jgi:hypothetical protein
MKLNLRSHVAGMVICLVVGAALAASGGVIMYWESAPEFVFVGGLILLMSAFSVLLLGLFLPMFLAAGRKAKPTRIREE